MLANCGANTHILVQGCTQGGGFGVNSLELDILQKLYDLRKGY